MPYYPPQSPGLLSTLAGAVATYFTTKNQIQEDQIQRQYMQQQMQQAAALAPLTLQKTQADIDETKANTAYESMLTQPMDPGLQTMLDKGAVMPTEQFVDPNKSVSAQVAASHQYYLQLQKHLTGLNHQLAMLDRMPPSQNVKDAMESIKDEIAETKSALTGVQTDMRDLTVFGARQGALSTQPITPQQRIEDVNAAARTSIEQRRLQLDTTTGGKGPADTAAIDSASRQMENEIRHNRNPAALGEQIKEIAIERGATTKTLAGIDAAISKYGKLWADKNAGNPSPYTDTDSSGSSAAAPSTQRTPPPP